MNTIGNITPDFVYSNTGEVYYPCHYCDRAFKYKKSFNTHIDKCHSQEHRQIQEPTVYIDIFPEPAIPNNGYYNVPATNTPENPISITLDTHKSGNPSQENSNKRAKSKKHLQSVIENIVDKKLKQAGLLRPEEEEPGGLNNDMESLNLDEFFYAHQFNELPDVIDIDEHFIENNPDMELQDANRFDQVRINPQLLNSHKGISLKDLQNISKSPKKTNLPGDNSKYSISNVKIPPETTVIYLDSKNTRQRVVPHSQSRSTSSYKSTSEKSSLQITRIEKPTIKTTQAQLVKTNAKLKNARVLRSDLTNSEVASPPKNRQIKSAKSNTASIIEDIEILSSDSEIELAESSSQNLLPPSSDQSIAERIQKFNQSQRAINYLKTSQSGGAANSILNRHSLINPRISIGSNGQPTITYDITAPDKVKSKNIPVGQKESELEKLQTIVKHLPGSSTLKSLTHKNYNREDAKKKSTESKTKPDKTPATSVNSDVESPNKAFEVIINDKNIIKVYGQPKLTIGPTGVPVITLSDDKLEENEDNSSNSGTDVEIVESLEQPAVPDDLIIIEDDENIPKSDIKKLDSAGAPYKKPERKGKLSGSSIAQMPSRVKDTRTKNQRTNYLTKLRRRREEDAGPTAEIEHEVATIGPNLLKLTIRQKSVTSRQDNATSTTNNTEQTVYIKHKNKKSKDKREKQSFRVVPRSRNPLMMKFKKITKKKSRNGQSFEVLTSSEDNSSDTEKECDSQTEKETTSTQNIQFNNGQINTVINIPQIQNMDVYEFEDSDSPHSNTKAKRKKPRKRRNPKLETFKICLSQNSVNNFLIKNNIAHETSLSTKRLFAEKSPTTSAASAIRTPEKLNSSISLNETPEERDLKNKIQPTTSLKENTTICDVLVNGVEQHAIQHPDKTNAVETDITIVEHSKNEAAHCENKRISLRTNKKCVAVDNVSSEIGESARKDNSTIEDLILANINASNVIEPNSEKLDNKSLKEDEIKPTIETKVLRSSKTLETIQSMPKRELRTRAKLADSNININVENAQNTIKIDVTSSNESDFPGKQEVVPNYEIPEILLKSLNLRRNTSKVSSEANVQFISSTKLVVPAVEIDSTKQILASSEIIPKIIEKFNHDTANVVSAEDEIINHMENETLLLADKNQEDQVTMSNLNLSNKKLAIPSQTKTTPFKKIELRKIETLTESTKIQTPKSILIDKTPVPILVNETQTPTLANETPKSVLVTKSTKKIVTPKKAKVLETSRRLIKNVELEITKPEERNSNDKSEQQITSIENNAKGQASIIDKQNDIASCAAVNSSELTIQESPKLLESSIKSPKKASPIINMEEICLSPEPKIVNASPSTRITRSSISRFKKVPITDTPPVKTPISDNEESFKIVVTADVHYCSNDEPKKTSTETRKSFNQKSTQKKPLPDDLDAIIVETPDPVEVKSKSKSQRRPPKPRSNKAKTVSKATEMNINRNSKQSKSLPKPLNKSKRIAESTEKLSVPKSKPKSSLQTSKNTVKSKQLPAASKTSKTKSTKSNSKVTLKTKPAPVPKGSRTLRSNITTQRGNLKVKNQKATAKKRSVPNQKKTQAKKKTNPKLSKNNPKSTMNNLKQLAVIKIKEEPRDDAEPTEMIENDNVNAIIVLPKPSKSKTKRKPKQKKQKVPPPILLEIKQEVITDPEPATKINNLTEDNNSGSDSDVSIHLTERYKSTNISDNSDKTASNEIVSESNKNAINKPGSRKSVRISKKASTADDSAKQNITEPSKSQTSSANSTNANEKASCDPNQTEENLSQQTAVNAKSVKSSRKRKLVKDTNSKQASTPGENATQNKLNSLKTQTSPANSVNTEEKSCDQLQNETNLVPQQAGAQETSVVNAKPIKVSRKRKLGKDPQPNASNKIQKLMDEAVEEEVKDFDGSDSEDEYKPPEPKSETAKSVDSAKRKRSRPKGVSGEKGKSKPKTATASKTSTKTKTATKFVRNKPPPKRAKTQVKTEIVKIEDFKLPPLKDSIDSVVIANEHVCLKCGKVCKDFIEFETHKKTHHHKIRLAEDELIKYDEIFS